MTTMKEREYKAREKIVQKMGRDGLVEEPLGSGERTGTSKRQAEASWVAEETEALAAFRKKHDSEKLTHGKPEREAIEAPKRGKRRRSDRSLRRGNIRGHPARMGQDTEPSTGTGRAKEKTQERGQFKKEQETRNEARHGKPKKRLSFSDEKNGMVRGLGMAAAKKAAPIAMVSSPAPTHGKGQEETEDNAALQAAGRAEQMAEKALRHASSKSKRREQYRHFHPGKRRESEPVRLLRFEAEGAAEKTVEGQATAQAKRTKHEAVDRFWQKKRHGKLHQPARHGKQSAGRARAFPQKARRLSAKVVKAQKGALAFTIAAMLLLVSMAAGVSSCGAMISGGASVVIGTTYASTDEDIYAVEAAYSRLESALNGQVGSMEARHPGYDEYRYQVDEISHDPYQLVSYFTALYGGFTYEQVKGEIKEIFHEQYGIATDSTRKVVKEKKSVRVGQPLGQVVTSGYCGCAICCGQWAGGATASGAYPEENHTIAVDATNPFVPMGTKVVMNGVEYVVEDTGNFARYGVQFDVYYADHGSASAHGHQTWDAYIADSNGSQEVEVVTVKMVNRLDVTLKNHGLDAVLRARMDENEEKRYDAYNATYGNRDYLFDKDGLPSYGNDGFRYDIPPEALSDKKFAKMIREAEKYLGYPYVWGGSSPSTSFDCSGFVSWVVNHCGNGWDFGRQTAEGFRSSVCAYVAPQDAKPGDLIFFQGTYSTSGASHIGIYVGNNMMIHCGNPVQYAKINTSYWKQHFLAFGRLP